MSQFDKETATKQADSYAKPTASLSLLDQQSKKSTLRASSRENLTSSSQPTKFTVKNRVGPRIEDDITTSILEQPFQNFKEYTIRVPVEEARWSNTNFDFAVVTSVSIVPAPVIRSIEE